NLVVYGPLSDGLTPYPSTGILLAQSDITLNSGNYDKIDNVSVSGRFTLGSWYVYGVCCSVGTIMGGVNATPFAPNAFAWALTDSNYLGATSSFANIATGNRGASGWTCVRCEMHAFTGAATLSPKALLLEGAVSFLYSGGIL